MYVWYWSNYKYSEIHFDSFLDDKALMQKAAVITALLYRQNEFVQGKKRKRGRQRRFDRRVEMCAFRGKWTECDTVLMKSTQVKYRYFPI